MRKRFFPILAVALLILTQTLASCLDDKDNSTDYTEWRQANETFFEQMAAKKDENGQPYYEQYSPDWAKGVTLLIRRHRQAPPEAMRPMDNSLCNVVYQGKLYNGTVFDSSFAKTDSVYQCKPCNMITGFWATMTTMAEGDSVTVIIPSNAAYGENGISGINPYSTLVFELKLKKIVSWDSPMH